MDLKQILLIAAGVIVVGVIVIVAAFFVLDNGGSPAATPTPAPSASPVASAAPTAAGATPTARPSATAVATAAPGGAIVVQAKYNATMGYVVVTMYLNTGAAPVDASKLSIDLMSGSQTYHSGWQLKSSDWAPGNGNSMLEKNEAVSTQINANALGMPQSSSLIVLVMQDGSAVAQTTATPF